jgi:molybdopterin molybdotransferase
MVSYEEALSLVRKKCSEANVSPATETVPLQAARGRILAEEVRADRDYPPFHRATRDGYALRTGDLTALPASLRCVGEVRAGEPFAGKVGPGQCVVIMTGAPLPTGADAVVMLEHTRAAGEQVEVLHAVGLWANVVLQGSEAKKGATVLSAGRRVDAGELGLLAMVGQASVRAFSQPTVAILPTGDEVVPVGQRPEWFQVRNSNAIALAAQVEAAGGIPRRLDIAPDRKEPLRERVVEGLRADLLVLTGGVSKGKYDLVETVLAELGAEFYFQGVAIRPGKPLAFGRACGKFFFGLPGNPVSTYVTFEVFVRPAIALLGGAAFEPPSFLRARLAKPFRQKTGLTVFMPARVEVHEGDPVVDLVGWQGSGDLVGVAASNSFLVVHPDQTDLAAGDWVDVMAKPA